MGRWGGQEGWERDGDGWGGGVDGREGREMVTDGEVGWTGGMGERW